MNEESLYVNPAYGVKSFMSLEQVRSRDFLKGGIAVFLFSMKGLLLYFILIRFIINYIFGALVENFTLLIIANIGYI